MLTVSHIVTLECGTGNKKGFRVIKGEITCTVQFYAPRPARLS
jgi:hypothetical protein